MRSISRELHDLIKTVSAIKNYHLDYKEAISNFSKPKYVLRLWVNKDEFDLYNVNELILDRKDFETRVREIVRIINVNVIFDIYYV